jgi:hypothetical protein
MFCRAVSTLRATTGLLAHVRKAGAINVAFTKQKFIHHRMCIPGPPSDFVIKGLNSAEILKPSGLRWLVARFVGRSEDQLGNMKLDDACSWYALCGHG